MKLYKAKVRLSGSLQHEVLKHDITAAEIIIYQHIHGDDAVVDVEETGSVNRPTHEEHDRLSMFFDKADRPSVVTQLFGAPYAAKFPEEAVTVPVVKKRRGAA